MKLRKTSGKVLIRLSQIAKTPPIDRIADCHDAFDGGVTVDELRNSFRKDKRPSHKKISEAVQRLAISGLILAKVKDESESRSLTESYENADISELRVNLTSDGVTVVNELICGYTDGLTEALVRGGNFVQSCEKLQPPEHKAVEKNRAMLDSLESIAKECSAPSARVVEYQYADCIPATELQGKLNEMSGRGFRLAGCASYLGGNDNRPMHWCVFERPTSVAKERSGQNGKVKKAKPKA